MNRMMTILTAAALAVATGFAQTPTKAAQGARSASAPERIGAAQLRADMRKLWTDHVVWTRDYIIAELADRPDVTTAAKRLMKNQEDIGAAIGKFYGASAGQQLTTLLKAHISIAVEVIKAAKASDKEAGGAADKRWHANGTEIAEFLSKANPKNWPRGQMVAMMEKHLLSTTNEVTARVTRNWEEDVRTFDAVYDHILVMADAVSDGIMKQFPERVK